MTRKIYMKCDECGKEFASPNETQRFLHLDCGLNDERFPHGDFVPLIAYLYM